MRILLLILAVSLFPASAHATGDEELRQEAAQFADLLFKISQVNQIQDDSSETESAQTQKTLADLRTEAIRIRNHLGYSSQQANLKFNIARAIHENYSLIGWVQIPVAAAAAALFGAWLGSGHDSALMHTGTIAGAITGTILDVAFLAVMDINGGNRRLKGKLQHLSSQATSLYGIDLFCEELKLHGIAVPSSNREAWLAQSIEGAGADLLLLSSPELIEKEIVRFKQTVESAINDLNNKTTEQAVLRGALERLPQLHTMKHKVFTSRWADASLVRLIQVKNRIRRLATELKLDTNEFNVNSLLNPMSLRLESINKRQDGKPSTLVLIPENALSRMFIEHADSDILSPRLLDIYHSHRDPIHVSVQITPVIKPDEETPIGSADIAIKLKWADKEISLKLNTPTRYDTAIDISGERAWVDAMKNALEVELHAIAIDEPSTPSPLVQTRVSSSCEELLTPEEAEPLSEKLQRRL